MIGGKWGGGEQGVKRPLYINSAGIPLNLAFFNDSAGEKTEPATPRKKEKAREEGQVLKSQEISVAILFLTTFLGLRVFASYIYTGVLTFLDYGIDMIQNPHASIEPGYIAGYINNALSRVLLISLPMFAIVMLAGLLVNLLQVGWHPTTKPLSPKFSKMNPIKGLKRIISMRAVVELVKSLLKLVIIGLGIYMMVINEMPMLAKFMYMDLEQSFIYIGDLAINVGVMVGGMYIFIAGFDYLYNWWKHTKELKMSKQEVKEEYKQTEGNPQIKGAIRGKMREASMRRMMRQVPQADVIITNPTHYAVALKYDRSMGEAPVVVAKGIDFLAVRIREKAKENGVEIIENKPLARTLYDSVEVGREIPPELYQAIAEIFAYLVNMNKIAV